MHFLPTLASAAALLANVADASVLTPPVLPLLVRTPYFSTWLGNARDAPWNKWPMFYTGEEIGFSVLASVPDGNKVYPLLGRPQDSLDPDADDTGYDLAYPYYKGAQFDASTTNLTYHIPSPEDGEKPAEVILSFLSPITPTSTLRQSIPAGYITVYVSGTFDLDIYMDVNGQWVSGDRNAKIKWDLKEGSSEDAPKQLKTWKVQRDVEALYTETHDRSEWGHLLFSAPTDVRHEAGTSAKLRSRFSRTGTLQNEQDGKFRGIMDNEPVFAFSKSFKLSADASLGVVSNESVTFTMAHIQDPVVQYAAARGMTDMRPLWRSWFPTDEQVVHYHYLDFPNAVALAQNYSDQLDKDALQSGSQDYVEIVALSARQVMGATSFSGTPDNPLLFLKEISSNGNSQTIDVIFPAFPFFLYTNPRWLAYLLEPLIEHMLSGQYPNKYAMHDLGTHFPNETGHPDGRDEYMPVEECGDILIMGLALVNSLMHGDGHEAQSIWSTVGNTFWDTTSESIFALTHLGEESGIANIDDTWGGGIKGAAQAKKWLNRSYRLWKQWTGYLVEFSLRPQNQLSTDDFAGWLALQTNLALKGIIGIKAMSELAEVVDNHEDAKHFRNVSNVYIKKWQGFAMSRDDQRAKLAYNWEGSWTTLYSLYADALLCFHPSTNSSDAQYLGGGHDDPQKPIPGRPGRTPISHDFIPSSIYSKQSKWYNTVMQKYGLPLDQRHLYTKTDWEFEAAAVASKPVRADILERVAKWLNETITDRPFTDLHNTEGKGGFPGPNFFARPVVGAHYAFLTLERACGGRAMEGLRFLDEDVNEAEQEEDWENVEWGPVVDEEWRKIEEEDKMEL